MDLLQKLERRYDARLVTAPVHEVAHVAVHPAEVFILYRPLRNCWHHLSSGALSWQWARAMHRAAHSDDLTTWHVHVALELLQVASKRLQLQIGLLEAMRKLEDAFGGVHKAKYDDALEKNDVFES